MANKLVVKLEGMNNDKKRQKAISAACDIRGIDFIKGSLEEQTVTVIGEMDADEVIKKLKKRFDVAIIYNGSA